ncbi:GpE family phage tail protein [Pantoea sp. Lij88]|nr:GpE family phage tail protein [Pantoea sp. Lij88]WHQ77137.1 GpE family phage tail protein [Pantoea sp. Lij88]
MPPSVIESMTLTEILEWLHKAIL